MDSVKAIIEEFEIEKLMRGNGVARFHKNADKAVKKSQESKTEYGMLLHKTKLEMLTEAIERYLQQYKGLKGRIPIAHEKLSDLVVMSVNPTTAPEKVIWASNPENRINDLPCVGLSGDAYYYPMQVQGDYLDYTGVSSGNRLRWSR